MKLRSVLATKGSRVVTTTPDATIREAIAMLTEHNVGALLVVGPGETLAGIISERDIIRAFAQREGVMALTVADLMTTSVVSGTPADDIEPVLQTMTARHFRHLPVVDDGHLVGLITIGDLVKAQLTHYRGTVDTLELRLMESGRAVS